MWPGKPHHPHRLGPLLVAEVVGQGLGLERAEHTLHRGIKGTPAASSQATATLQLLEQLLEGMWPTGLRIERGTHPPRPQVWATTSPSWPWAAYSAAEDGQGQDQEHSPGHHLGGVVL